MELTTLLTSLLSSPFILIIPPAIIFYYFLKDDEDFDLAKIMGYSVAGLVCALIFVNIMPFPMLMTLTFDNNTENSTPAVEDNPYLDNITNITKNATNPAWDNDWFK